MDAMTQLRLMTLGAYVVLLVLTLGPLLGLSWLLALRDRTGAPRPLALHGLGRASAPSAPGVRLCARPFALSGWKVDVGSFLERDK